VARLFEGASRGAGKRAGYGHRVWLSDEEKRKYVEKMKKLEQGQDASLVDQKIGHLLRCHEAPKARNAPPM
jgi:hypothetical protein